MRYLFRSLRRLPYSFWEERVLWGCPWLLLPFRAARLAFSSRCWEE